jgi:hypothetical protein
VTERLVAFQEGRSFMELVQLGGKYVDITCARVIRPYTAMSYQGLSKGCKFFAITLHWSINVLKYIYVRDTLYSGLENRDYGRRGSAALTMRHPSIRKRWH